MFEKLLDALLNLFDDVRDARELRILQLRGDIRKAWGLSLLEIGKTCTDEGEQLIRIREGFFSRPYVAPRVWLICGSKHPCVADICCRKPPHSIDEPHSNGDVVWNWPETVHICSSQHNSSDIGWFNCRRETGHPGDHMGAGGKRWAPEQTAPSEQPGVISTEYDD